MLLISSTFLLLITSFLCQLGGTALSMPKDVQEVPHLLSVPPTGSILLVGRKGATRRAFGWSLLAGAASLPAATTAAPGAVSAAETVGKDPACNDASCLGVWDGLLADCPHGGGGSATPTLLGTNAGCTASQDDTPGIFAEPWDYSENLTLDWSKQMSHLVMAIQQVSAERGDTVQTALQEGRYLRVEFTDGTSGEKSVGEFYFTPNDTTVQFRIGSEQNRGFGAPLLAPPSLRNAERAERIRKRLGYLKLPVLRNRRRTLLFGESDLDTFGPGSSALGPPAEMRIGELEGRILE